MLFALSASGTCLALIVLAPVFAVAASLFVLRGFFTNLSWPFHQSLLMATTVPEERATAVGSGFAVWGITNALGPLASGAMLGAGIFVVPLVVGSTMYFLGGLAFGIGFSRILARRRDASAPAVATLGGDGDP